MLEKQVINQTIMTELSNSLWIVWPLSDQQKQQEVINVIFDTCQKFLRKEIDTQKFDMQMIKIVKEILAAKNK